MDEVIIDLSPLIDQTDEIIQALDILTTTTYLQTGIISGILLVFIFFFFLKGAE